MKFGIWLPVYGGWLRADGFDTQPSTEECIELAVRAERSGFDVLYVSENFLNCIHGPEHDVIDAWTLLAAVARETRRIELVGALKPSFRPSLVSSQMTATVDRLSGGRLNINIVCGWWDEEFERAGIPWLQHDEKYEFSDRYLNELEQYWKGASDDGIVPRRYLAGSRRRPPIWVSGHSAAALSFADLHADCLFLNGMSVTEMNAFTASYRRKFSDRKMPAVAMNAFVIMAETDRAAFERRDWMLSKARPDLLALYRNATTRAGAKSWENLTDEQLIDANGGFASAVIGSPRTVLARLAQFEAAGVDLLICQFPNTTSDVDYFAKSIVGAPSSAMAITLQS